MKQTIVQLSIMLTTLIMWATRTVAVLSIKRYSDNYLKSTQEPWCHHPKNLPDVYPLPVPANNGISKSTRGETGIVVTKTK